MLVKLRAKQALKQRQQVVPEIGAAGHPLVEVSAVVVIRAVQLPSRKGSLQPTEEGFVPDVHFQCHLRLTTVSAEVTFADQDPGEKTELEVARHLLVLRHLASWLLVIGADQSSRSISQTAAVGCFTVRFHVEPSPEHIAVVLVESGANQLQPPAPECHYVAALTVSD